VKSAAYEVRYGPKWVAAALLGMIQLADFREVNLE